MPTYFRLQLLLAVAIIFLCVPRAVAADRPVAFTHVNVIDTTGGPTQHDMTVVVTGQRIVKVAKTGRAATPNNMQVVDGRGKYLIPGLWDMHVHTVFGEWLAQWTGEKISFPLFVANGVTGVRDMGGDLAIVKQWRSDIASRKLLGPRLVIAGPMLDGPKPRFPSSVGVGTPKPNEPLAPSAARSDRPLYQRLEPAPYAAFSSRAAAGGTAAAARAGSTG